MTVTINGTTGIAVPLGSVSAPGVSNTTSSTTGLYNPTGTTLGIATNGTNALYIDASQNVGVGTITPSAKLEVGSGNLNFSGTGQRVTGDFTNATVTNRLAFQTSTTNSSTGIYALPNGTSTAASWQATNAADPTNASKILIATNGSTDVQLVSGINGTGTYLPLSFYTNGANKMQLDVNGNLNIATTGVAAKLYVNGNAASVISALTDAATITPDFSVANNFSVTLGGNRTLANPTNLTVGQSGIIYVSQDGTGSRTLAYGSYWKFPGGTAPTLTTTASAVDALVYVVRTSTSITVNSILNIG